MICWGPILTHLIVLCVELLPAGPQSFLLHVRGRRERRLYVESFTSARLTQKLLLPLRPFEFYWLYPVSHQPVEPWSASISHWI